MLFESLSRDEGNDDDDGTMLFLFLLLILFLLVLRLILLPLLPAVAATNDVDDVVAGGGNTMINGRWMGLPSAATTAARAWPMEHAAATNSDFILGDERFNHLLGR